jgi:hypothetical protein
MTMEIKHFSRISGMKKKMIKEVIIFGKIIIDTMEKHLKSNLENM